MLKFLNNLANNYAQHQLEKKLSFFFLHFIIQHSGLYKVSIYMLCVQCYKSHCVRSCFVWRGNAVVKTCIVRDLSPDKLWGFVK